MTAIMAIMAIHQLAAASSNAFNGYPLSRQPKKPPASGRTLLIPFFLSCSAARALEASFGQVQYRTTSPSLGISS